MFDIVMSEDQAREDLKYADDAERFYRDVYADDPKNRNLVEMALHQIEMTRVTVRAYREQKPDLDTYETKPSGIQVRLRVWRLRKPVVYRDRYISMLIHTVVVYAPEGAQSQVGEVYESTRGFRIAGTDSLFDSEILKAQHRQSVKDALQHIAKGEVTCTW